MQATDRTNLRHLKQVARGLYSAGLYATHRAALVAAQGVRRRIDEQRMTWADAPNPRYMRLGRPIAQSPIRRSLGYQPCTSTRAIRAGHLAPSLGA